MQGKAAAFEIALQAPCPHGVMAGLDPAIHVFHAARRTWMPGTSPGMTAAFGAPPPPFPWSHFAP